MKETVEQIQKHLNVYNDIFPKFWDNFYSLYNNREYFCDNSEVLKNTDKLYDSIIEWERAKGAGNSYVEDTANNTRDFLYCLSLWRLGKSIYTFDFYTIILHTQLLFRVLYIAECRFIFRNKDSLFQDNYHTKSVL